MLAGQIIFFFQAEDGIRDGTVTGVQTCALPIADLVIFDPDTVDCGKIEMRPDLPGNETRLYARSVGIHHVIVNGVPVARDNEPTGHLSGKVLRSGRDTVTVLPR